MHFPVQGKLYLIHCDESLFSVSPLKCHWFSTSHVLSDPKGSKGVAKMTGILCLDDSLPF